IKNAIEKHGLTYIQESHEQSKQSADNLINDIGTEKALEAVRNNEIQGGTESFVWGSIINKVDEQLTISKDPAEIERLNDLQADLKSEFDQKMRNSGRGISALQSVYKLYDFEYNLANQLEKYENANDGVVPPDIEAKFREYDRQMKELKEKLSIAEKKAEGRDETIENIKEGMERKQTKFNLKEKTEEGNIRIPNSLIRDLVKDGIDNINDLTIAVKEAIKDDYPDATIREVRDAITNYGKTINMSKEEIDVKIRKLKRMGKLISGIEDVKLKKRPLRSGLQRDKLDAEERDLGKELKELMKDLPVTEEEMATKWKSALDAIKTRLKNNIEDLNRRIKTGIKPPAKKQVEYDAEAKILKEKRDNLKKIVEELEGKPGITEEERVKIAVKGVERSIAELQRRINEKELITPKGKPVPQTIELQKLKGVRAELKSELMKMQEAAGIPEKKRLESMKKRLVEQTKKLQERIWKKDFAPKKKASLLPMDAEITRLKAEKNRVKELFDIEQEKVEIAKQPLVHRFWEEAKDIMFNIPKTMRASLDMSAPLRQGIVFSSRIITRPMQTASEFKHMFKVAFSEKKSDDWLRYIKASPMYINIMKPSGLFLADSHAKISAREEMYQSNLVKKIPIYKHLAAVSDRAYSGFLNKQRVDVFLDFYEKMNKEGINYNTNPEIFKAWAKYVNNATGRGSLGELEMAANTLSNVFFSPRLIAARLNLINPITYAKMPKQARIAALKSNLEFVSVGLTVLLLAALAGADVELDWRSTDFGKIKIG
ncbi:MAG: hypothetical protein KKB31_02020, partial [Nanoarchaeota archaeon]|nr:hypothetical protein [Nanoarchaeota archaeon]